MNSGASFSTVNSFDLDHYLAQPGNWNVQVQQLSRGAFSSQIRSLQYDDLIAYDNRWGSASLIRGESPSRWIMFGGIISPERAPVHWCGQVTDARYFACTPESHAIEFAVDSGAHDVVLLITPALLTQVAGDNTLGLIKRAGIIDFEQRGRHLLHVVMNNILRLEQADDVLRHEILAADIRANILAALSRCFNLRDHEQASILTRSRKENAVHEAIQSVWESSGKTSAWQMASEAGVSQKTLELAFSEAFGLTPGQYLKLYRLNQAHRKLSESTPDDTSVTEVALSLGFTHPGRFSTAYKGLFREPPSKTLRSLT